MKSFSNSRSFVIVQQSGFTFIPSTISCPRGECKFQLHRLNNYIRFVRLDVNVNSGLHQLVRVSAKIAFETTCTSRRMINGSLVQAFLPCRAAYLQLNRSWCKRSIANSHVRQLDLRARHRERFTCRTDPGRLLHAGAPCIIRLATAVAN